MYDLRCDLVFNSASCPNREALVQQASLLRLLALACEHVMPALNASQRAVSLPREMVTVVSNGKTVLSTKHGRP